MTHTVHRRGDKASLEDDYVLLAMSAKGVNDKGSAEKMKQLLKIAAKHNPVNLGNMTSGNLQRRGFKGVFERFTDQSIVHAPFAEKENLIECLKELRQEDLGMSVVISGDFDGTFACLREAGLTPHTVQYSLGVFGKTLRLPSEDVLELTTMCGHHLVSPNLVKKMLLDLKRGRISLEEASQTLAKQCQCGVFNPSKAIRLLERMLENQQQE